MDRGILRVGLGATALLLLALALGFGARRTTVVERADEIAAPPATVYELLVDLRAARRWSPWRDARSRYVFSGPQIGVGAHMQWSGTSRGSTTVSAAEPYRFVAYRIERRGGLRRATFRLTRSAQGTHVVWRMETDGGLNPLARWRNLLLADQTRISLERGLDRLGDVAEALPHVDMAAAHVVLVQQPPRRFLYVEGETRPDPESISRALAQGSRRVAGALAAAGLAPSAGPVWIAEEPRGTGMIAYRAGLPFEAPGAPAGSGLRVGELPAGPAVRAEHVGPPADLPQTEAAARLFRGLHQLGPTGPPVVGFSGDPATTPPERLVITVSLPVRAGA